MDEFEKSLFESVRLTATPESLPSSTFSADNYDSFSSRTRKRSADGSVDSYFDPAFLNGESNDKVRRQRRKEQNRAAQRAYRERKVTHTIELEGRINYLEVHIEELRIENKQLEGDISRTRVENGVLRKTLLGQWQAQSGATIAPPPTPVPPNPVPKHSSPAKPVLLKDLLMVYGQQDEDETT